MWLRHENEWHSHFGLATPITGVKHIAFRKLILLSLILCSTLAFADANDGEFLGFTLGEKFNVPRGSDGIEHITGAMIYTVDAGLHAHHIDSISVYVSPGDSIVGGIFGERYFPNPRAAGVFADRYLCSLETKYSHWVRRGRSLTFGDYQLWVDIEEKSSLDYDWSEDHNTRVAIALIYAPDSPGRSEWMTLIGSELGEIELASSR